MPLQVSVGEASCRPFRVDAHENVRALIPWSGRAARRSFRSMSRPPTCCNGTASAFDESERQDHHRRQHSHQGTTSSVRRHAHAGGLSRVWRSTRASSPALLDNTHPEVAGRLGNARRRRYSPSCSSASRRSLMCSLPRLSRPARQRLLVRRRSACTRSSALNACGSGSRKTWCSCRWPAQLVMLARG